MANQQSNHNTAQVHSITSSLFHLIKQQVNRCSQQWPLWARITNLGLFDFLFIVLVQRMLKQAVTQRQPVTRELTERETCRNSIQAPSMSQGVRRAIPLKIMSPKINWISAPLSISDWFSENTGFYRTGSGSASDVSKTEALQLFSTLTYYLRVAQQKGLSCLLAYSLHTDRIYILQFNKQGSF